MKIVYSKHGLPVSAPDDVDSDVVFVSKEVTQVYETRIENKNISFSDELHQIETLLSMYSLSGGLFKIIHDNKVEITANAKSFILETAQLILGKIAQRRVSFQDWSILLLPGADDVKTTPTFSKEEMIILQELRDMSNAKLFQTWINQAGLNDLSQFMQVYVGE